MNKGATIDKDSRLETAHANGSGFGGAAASGWGGGHRETDEAAAPLNKRGCNARLQREPEGNSWCAIVSKSWSGGDD